MADLISLVEAKRWLSIDVADTTRDDILTDLVSAASEACIGVMGQDPTPATRTLVVNAYGGSSLPLNYFPITAVGSLTIRPDLGSSPLPANQYYFDDHTVSLRCGTFPREKQSVGITFTAGLATVPASIKLAVKYTVKAFWDARATDMNSAGESFAGVGGSSFWPTGPGSVPPQAVDLLMRHFNAMRV